MKKPRANRKQPHASRQRRQTRAPNPDRDDRVARLLASHMAGGAIDELAIAAAAEREGLTMAAIWSALERDGWRAGDDGVYRQTRAQRPTTAQADAAQDTGYLSRVMAAVSAGGVVRAGEVTTVTVAHDDGCPRLHDGPCCCIPEIEACGPDGRVRTIDVDGEVDGDARQH